MKNQILFSLLMFLGVALQAQDIMGDWFGILDPKGMQLNVVFHISREGESLKAKMDSPDQKSYGLQVDEVTFTNNELLLKAYSLGVTYTGVINNTGDTVNGTFEQGGAKLNLVLTRSQPEKKEVIRPQDPKEFPYYTEDVIINNSKANIELAGTLTLPPNKKVDKIVILISGSGPQNRNEEVFNHRPFLVLADWLTRQGIGVLRYDDRGVGKSTGNFGDASSVDFADDTEAAVNYLLSRSDLKDVSIGLIGHSEGGMIAPMVATRNPNVAFIVLLAGPGVPIDQLLIRQTRDISALEKIPENLTDLNIETFEKTLSFLNQNKNMNDEQMVEGLTKILKEQYEKYPESSSQKSYTEEQIKTEAKQQSSKWFRYFASYEPAKYLEKVTCPVLAVNGTLDCQVEYSGNLEAIRLALAKANNKNSEILPLEGLNHLFQKANTGNVSEYAQIDETIDSAALTKVSDWIKKI
jgi:uncharacterized protein